MASDMRLTQAQKRDLLRMSGAAVVSTIFFGVPMIVGKPEVARLQVVSGHRQQAPPSPAQMAPVVAPSAPQVSIVFSDSVAQPTTPELQVISVPAATRPARSSRQNAAAARTRSNTQVASVSGKPFARRLGRLLAGTGRYEVKPFPTISTPGS